MAARQRVDAQLSVAHEAQPYVASRNRRGGRRFRGNAACSFRRSAGAAKPRRSGRARRARPGSSARPAGCPRAARPRPWRGSPARCLRVPDTIEHFGVTRQFAAVLLGEGGDERVGGDLAVQTRDGTVQDRPQHAEDPGERVLPHHRPDRVDQRTRRAGTPARPAPGTLRPHPRRGRPRRTRRWRARRGCRTDLAAQFGRLLDRILDGLVGAVRGG